MQSGLELAKHKIQTPRLSNREKFLALIIVALDSSLGVTAQLMLAFPGLKNEALIEKACDLQLATHLKITMGFYPETYQFKQEVQNLRNTQVELRQIIPWSHRLSMALTAMDAAMNFNISPESIQFTVAKLVTILKAFHFHLDRFRPSLVDKFKASSATKGCFVQESFDIVRNTHNTKAQKLYIDCCSHLHFFTSLNFRLQACLSPSEEISLKKTS